MHILHAVFTAELGGLEQAYVDVTEALASRGYQVTALLHKNAPYRDAVAKHADAIFSADPNGFYDVLSAWKIRQLLKSQQPHIILAHNARAISLMLTASKGMHIPVCGLSHSYKTSRTMRADALIVLTPHMRVHFIQSGYPADKIHVISNMIRLPKKFTKRKLHDPVNIGAIGRLSEAKAFDHMLKALHLVKENGMPFTAQIAGEGPQKTKLQAMIGSLGLSDCVRLEGWVDDKTKFYRGMDIMCMPSCEESFGLVILEAMAHGVPVVAADALGPAGIISNGKNGLIVPRGNFAAMSNALQLMTQGDLAERCAKAGWETAQEYAFKTVAKKWDETLTEIISTAKSRQAA